MDIWMDGLYFSILLIILFSTFLSCFKKTIITLSPFIKISDNKNNSFFHFLVRNNGFIDFYLNIGKNLLFRQLKNPYYQILIKQLKILMEKK